MSIDEAVECISKNCHGELAEPPSRNLPALLVFPAISQQ
jgi:hypothetical protein